MKYGITVGWLFFALIMFHLQPALGEAPKAGKPALYDESSDGNKQITDALTAAKNENKRVLLQFGANWCGWCHKLHNTFQNEKEIAENLKANFVVVLVDVNKNHNSDVVKKYGNPTRFGLPVIVILDNEGKQLTTKNTAELEKGRNHDPAKVLAFLKEWAPKK